MDQNKIVKQKLSENKIIVVGDLHLRHKQPYMKHQEKFLEWLLDNYSNPKEYKEYGMIFLGDIFDNSTPKWEVYNLFHEFLTARQNNSYHKDIKTFILTGNHDLSKQKGNSLLAFNNIEDVVVIENETIIDIHGLNCLFLPYKYNYKQMYLESNNFISKKFDLIFTHIMTEERQFSNEGMNFDNISEGCFVHGHDHMQGGFLRKPFHEHLILGVPYETRHLEAQEHRIMEIDIPENSKWNFKAYYPKVPIFFKHETIQYGDMPENKDNIYNVIDAPSRKAVYEKYADYYIRSAGIKILQTETTVEEHNKEFTHASLLERFNQFVNEFNISKEVADLCSQKILNIQEG